MKHAESYWQHFEGVQSKIRINHRKERIYNWLSAERMTDSGQVCTIYKPRTFVMQENGGENSTMKYYRREMRLGVVCAHSERQHRYVYGVKHNHGDYCWS